MNQDSAGRHIKIGSKVRFRGQVYTIKAFGDRTSRGAISIEFEEAEVHTSEQPDEWGVDLIFF